MRPSRDTRPAPRALGRIRGDEAMTLELFGSEMGQSRKGVREMERRGLKTVKCGKRKYVLGRHVLQFFEQLAEAEGKSR